MFNLSKASQLLNRVANTSLRITTLVLFTLVLFSCQTQPTKIGVLKNTNTGLQTSYANLIPEKAMIVMNNEVIDHNDIPFGETFYVVNDGIQGLIAKDKKVSVGCSLTIRDKTGKVLLQEADLYKDNDIYHKDSINYLRCAVSTGSPMQWEELYDVTVIFWDKFGTGKIENRVTIKCIDIP